jgi:hypothetical protein
VKHSRERNSVPLGWRSGRYNHCNLSGRTGVTPGAGNTNEGMEPYVFSCDYNGWADVPEEEREGIDAFDAARPPKPASPITPPYKPMGAQLLPVLWHPRESFTRRRAA